MQGRQEGYTHDTELFKSIDGITKDIEFHVIKRLRKTTGFNCKDLAETLCLI